MQTLTLCFLCLLVSSLCSRRWRTCVHIRSPPHCTSSYGRSVKITCRPRSTSLENILFCAAVLGKLCVELVATFTELGTKRERIKMFLHFEINCVGERELFDSRYLNVLQKTSIFTSAKSAIYCNLPDSIWPVLNLLLKTTLQVCSFSSPFQIKEPTVHRRRQ